MKAKCGLDYVRGPGWQPLTKTRKGWIAWGKREAKRLGTGFVFSSVVCDCGNYLRISFAGQPEKGR